MAFLKEERDLELISVRTISHYDSNAESFWEGTRGHDVSQNYQALLKALPSDRLLKILDLGCGPGRDLKYFKSLGHEVIGLEGSPRLCEMARVYAGCEVWRQDFLRMRLPDEAFDGIFANASLFHVPSQELERVLRELAHSLKPRGVLFSSNPRGSGEGWSGDARYANYMELASYQGYLQRAGFTVLEHYYRPAGLPREKQPWLAVVSRKS
jgi:SAM-dependent methyltransferase